MANLTRWDPFQQLADMQRELDRVFGRSGAGGRGATAQDPWMPPVDVEQTGECIVFKLDLPGVRPEDVEIELHARTLTVTGERKEEREESHEGYFTRERTIGRFTRSFMLPEAVRDEQIKASFRDGVLRVVVPRPAQERPRRITIEGGESAS